MKEAAASAPTVAEDPETARIRRRVHEKAELVRHLVVFLVAGSTLAAVDLLTSPRTLWFYWPMGAWAIGLLLQAADVFFTGEDAGMEARMLEHELERHGHG